MAGLALLIQPDAWIGVEKDEHGFNLIQHDGQTMRDQKVSVQTTRFWLRADCEFNSQLARFSYSTDGKSFHSVGDPFRMLFIGTPFQGVRYSLFNFHRGDGAAGFADFDSVDIHEPTPHALTKPIPYGSTITLQAVNHEPSFFVTEQGVVNVSTSNQAAAFTVSDQGLGRIALRGKSGFIAVGDDGTVSVKQDASETEKSFQWIETFTGELTLLSLQTHRYLRLDFGNGALHADSTGPEPDGLEGIRFNWQIKTAKHKH